MTTKNPPRLPFTPLFDDLLTHISAMNVRATSPGEADRVRMSREIVEGSARFICDDVAKWAFDNEHAGENSDAQGWQQTGPLMLPYPRMWIEWADPQHEGVRFGAMVLDARLGSLNVRATFGPGVAQAYHVMPVARMASGQSGSMFGAEALIAVDEKGDLVSEAIHIDPAATAIYGEEHLLDDVLRNAVRYVTTAIGMMNCKNVKTETHERKPRATKKQRRPRKGGLSYSTIKLPGHTYDRNGFVTGNGSGGRGVAAHTVRGHFATYTAEAPRLGRASDGIGTFWISPHVRGSKENGEVNPLYVVGPPKDATDTAA